MLLATKLGEMEWFPNEFQVDLLEHKTLCWRLEVGDFVSGRNLLRTTLPKTNIAPPIGISFCKSLFSGAMLVSGRVGCLILGLDLIGSNMIQLLSIGFSKIAQIWGKAPCSNEIELHDQFITYT